MTQNLRGRPAFTADKFNVVAALQSVANGERNVSYYLTRQLVEKGYVAANDVSTGGRGRPAKEYVLTGKGKTYLNFSRNWKK